MPQRFSLPQKSASTSLLLLLLFLCFPFSSNAGDDKQNVINEISSKAIEMALWDSIEWLNLLHYDKEYNSYISQVDDERFFYAADGRNNPKTELLETFKHLFIPTENHNNQTQCQFVARTAWLSEKLQINKNQFPAVHCENIQNGGN